MPYHGMRNSGLDYVVSGNWLSMTTSRFSALAGQTSPPEIAEALASLEASIKAKNAGLAAQSAEQQQSDATEASKGQPETSAAEDQPQMDPAGGRPSVRTNAVPGNESIAEALPASSTLDVQQGIDSSTANAATPVDNGAKTQGPQADNVMTKAAPTSSITCASQGAGDCHRRSNQGSAVPAGSPDDMPSLHALKGAAPSSPPMRPGSSQLGNSSTAPDSAGDTALQPIDADSIDARPRPGTSLLDDDEPQGIGDARSLTVKENSKTGDQQAIQQPAEGMQSSAPETQRAQAGAGSAGKTGDEASQQQQQLLQQQQQLLQQLQRQQIMDAAHMLPGPAGLLVTDLLDHR